MNNNFKNKVGLVLLIFFTVVSFSFLSVNLAKAQGATSSTPNSGVDNTSNTPNSGGGSSVVSLNNPLGTASIPEIIGRVISAALGIVGSLALIMFIYGGITWMTAAGNEQNVTKGKNIIIWATLGLVVIFSSYAIVRFVLQAIGA
ncbi:MAG TPA: pilin [bacterium]|nr:pilin [bacterium]